MKFFVIIFSLFIFFTPMRAIQEPRIPTVFDPSVRESSSESLQTNVDKTNLIFPLNLEIAGSTNVDVLYQSDQNFTLIITNKTSNSTEIRIFSLPEFSDIRILRWQPKLVKDNLYVFYPVEFVFNSGKETFRYRGRIRQLEELLVKYNDKDKKFYTLFFDRWQKGKKSLFHWKNSRTDRFDYPLTHPISGVVTALHF